MRYNVPGPAPGGEGGCGMKKRLAAVLRDSGGFTLVELIVVLVILGIMAAILVPSLTGYIDEANERKLVVECRASVAAAQALYSESYAQNGPGLAAFAPIQLFSRAFSEEEALGAGAPTRVSIADIQTLAEVPGTVSGIELSSMNQVLHLTYTNVEGRVITYCAYPDTCEDADHARVYNFVPGKEYGGPSGPEEPGPENPGPENPGPENPGPENPGPENPGPEDPGNPNPPVGDPGKFTFTDNGETIEVKVAADLGAEFDAYYEANPNMDRDQHGTSTLRAGEIYYYNGCYYFVGNTSWVRGNDLHYELDIEDTQNVVNLGSGPWTVVGYAKSWDPGGEPHEPGDIIFADGVYQICMPNPDGNYYRPINFNPEGIKISQW